VLVRDAEIARKEKVKIVRDKDKSINQLERKGEQLVRVQKKLEVSDRRERALRKTRVRAIYLTNL
tara:strand:+ start:39 stop:233 length:195 start_codon:yes stop_codon:yes gene_type:complete